MSAAGADSFAVTDRGGRTTTVAYPQVKKAQGHNLSTGAKIGIGVALTFAVLYVIYATYER